MKIASDVHCVKCCAQSIIGCNQEVSPGGGGGGVLQDDCSRCILRQSVSDRGLHAYM